MANEMRLIDANALTHEIIFVKKCLASEDKAGEWTKGYRSGLVAALAQIDETPTVDAVEVVRCKDCKHYNLYRLECHNGSMNGVIGINGFCSYGERREGE